MSRASSQLRLFVHFKEDTVFAGEDVECTITFKNVEVARKLTPRGRPAPREQQNPSRPNNPLEHLRAARAPSHTSRSRKPTSILPPAQSPHLCQRPSHRRSASSFSVVESANPIQGTPELPGGGFHIANAPAEKKHGRKVSIVSLGTSTGQQRPSIKHGRSASVQVATNTRQSHLHQPSLVSHRSQSLAHSPQSPIPLSPSPLSAASFNARSQRRSPSNSPIVSGRPQPSIATPRPNTKASSERSSSAGQNNFRFPPEPIQTCIPRIDPSIETTQSATAPSAARSRSPRSVLSQRANGISGNDDAQGATLSRVFSLRSMDGTPRSSLDLYSMSNHSNETLTSEVPAQVNAKLLPDHGLSRRSSLAQRPPVTENILMGYAQLSGSFVLDGSLVNQAPFEEVKRKAVVGGQGGGGVVGVTRPIAESGLFGAFTWNSIGESLGGIIGGGGPSSMNEMKGIAGSSSIPLLSTSKSILFVNLNLAPGQSRSYSYKFALPQGLPPSHKGRAMKVSYNLVVGTHRPGLKPDQPQVVKQVEIPFRVLSGVSLQGDYLGHDLMSPYIILKDQARTKAIDDETIAQLPQPHRPKKPQSSASGSAEDFNSYVTNLLTRPRRDSSYGLLSPTAEQPQTPLTPRTPRIPSITKSRLDPPLPSATTLIDHAIRYSTNPSSAIYTPTHYSISRSSIPIAVLQLSRPALKTGETLTVKIDFSTAGLPCYALEASLESSERVDPALAIRSPQSVERATRRVWASELINCVWARRAVFRAQIPVMATPGFVTSGVSLEWCLRVELVVGVSTPTAASASASASAKEDVAQSPPINGSRAERVLEVVHEDDRATVLAAKARLPCESFQVEIPIRILGAVVGSADEGVDLEGVPV